MRELCRLGDASAIIGSILAKILTPEGIGDVVVELAGGPAEPSLDQCLSGLLWSLAPGERARIYDSACAAAPVAIGSQLRACTG